MSRPKTRQKPSRSADMGQRALAEYEEMERRRYHERLRAEKKGAPMEITQEDRERVEAIAIIDETHLQYAELYRTGRCPSCEQILTWQEVDRQPEHERHEAAAGHVASRYLQWTSKHAPDCSFYERLQGVDNLAAKHHIVIMGKALDVPMPDGKVMRDLVPVRVPAAGDPPVEDR